MNKSVIGGSFALVAFLTFLGLAGAEPRRVRHIEMLNSIQSIAPEMFERLAKTEPDSTLTQSTDWVMAESSNNLTAKISMNPQKGIVINDKTMPGENIGISIGKS